MNNGWPISPSLHNCVCHMCSEILPPGTTEYAACASSVYSALIFKHQFTCIVRLCFALSNGKVNKSKTEFLWHAFAFLTGTHSAPPTRPLLPYFVHFILIFLLTAQTTGRQQLLTHTHTHIWVTVSKYGCIVFTSEENHFHFYFKWDLLPRIVNVCALNARM